MTADVQQLLLHYSALSDEELLSLAIDRNDLTSEADAALGEELSRRSLTSDDVNSFAVSLRDSDEPLSDVSSETLPPPQELPEDFFDDNEELADASQSSRRLPGIVLVATQFWLGVPVSIFIGLAIFETPAAKLTSYACAILYLLVGTDLFKLRRWAYRAAVAIVSITLCLNVLSILAPAVLLLSGYQTSFLLEPLYALLAVAYDLVIIMYLISPKVRDPERWR